MKKKKLIYMFAECEHEGEHRATDTSFKAAKGTLL